MTAPDVLVRALYLAVDLADLAARVGVAAEHVIPYGRDVAKIDLAALDREAPPQAGATCRAIADELQRKGLSASVIEGALSQIDSEVEAAVALARKKLAATRWLETDVRRRRTLALLGRKGYSAAVALQALARCWREPSPGDSPTRPGSGTGVPFALQPVRNYFLAQTLWFALESSLLETLNASQRMSAAQICEATGWAPYRVQGLCTSCAPRTSLSDPMLTAPTASHSSAPMPCSPALGMSCLWEVTPRRCRRCPPSWLIAKRS